jgi:hypothetical protein
LEDLGIDGKIILTRCEVLSCEVVTRQGSEVYVNTDETEGHINRLP